MNTYDLDLDLDLTGELLLNVLSSNDEFKTDLCLGEPKDSLNKCFLTAEMGVT